jgi:tetratricopeptide (TPR) repeat protein
VLEYDLSVPNFIDWSAKESKLKLPLEDYSQLMPPLEDDDPDPAKLYGPLTMTATLEVTLPDSISVTLPVPLSIKREYGSYSDKASFDNHVLRAERRLSIGVFELPQTKARDLTAFEHVIQTDTQQVASLKNSNTDTAAPPKQAKKEELEEAASNAQAAHKFALAVELLQRVVELDPKHPRAWNSMGLCYSALTQYSKAIEAYKKALEVNAYDETAYDYMAGAYEMEQKYDEAKASYRKQLEINPLDAYAHLSLGRLLMRDHNYKDAVTELEAANGIKADVPQTLQELGEAYLNTDQVEKAMTTFDKALEKSATPDVWNNIAYVLAKAKQHLERAQQYAESAVSSTDTLMRNLSSEQDEWVGRAVSANLATYWDTLGWVYFQQGDYAKALRYLLPAWEHSFNGEVGDHLAQVYEKKGEKQKAIELYATALGCPESIPDTKDHLAALLGKHAAPAVRKCAELAQKATVKSSAGDGSADMLLVFKGDGSIERVKLLANDKQFAPLVAAIQALKFGFGFPDTASHGFIHKATMECKAGTCTVTVAPADPNTLGAAGEAANGGENGGSNTPGGSD